LNDVDVDNNNSGFFEINDGKINVFMGKNKQLFMGAQALNKYFSHTLFDIDGYTKFNNGVIKC
jgi:hypothetical protein